MDGLRLVAKTFLPAAFAALAVATGCNRATDSTPQTPAVAPIVVEHSPPTAERPAPPRADFVALSSEPWFPSSQQAPSHDTLGSPFASPESRVPNPKSDIPNPNSKNSSDVVPVTYLAPDARLQASREPVTLACVGSPEALHQAIIASGEFLVGVCEPDGRFVYRVNLDPQVTPKPKYNILRHAGTIYALGMIDRCHPNPAVRDVMLRAAEWMKCSSLQPVPNEAGLLAIWSYPEINGSDDPACAKLGGTGLGLVALMSVERFAPGATPLEQLRALGRFLVSMQRDDGSFYSKYTPEHGGRDGRWESLYYPGEAALGLLMLDERDPSPIWRETAAKTLLYLARSRRDRITVEPDHWILLATARLLAQTPETLSPPQRQAALRHAVQICESMLTYRPRYATHFEAEGCLTPDSRTCPTATRLEGLTAALTFLPEEQVALRQQIRTAVDRGIAFLEYSQIRRGPYRGGMPRESLTLKPDGSFHFANERSGEIRIDYIQHAVSAMIQYDELTQR